MAMAQADAELTDRHHLLLWIAEILKRKRKFLSDPVEDFCDFAYQYFIEIASHHMNVARKALQVVVRLFCAQVSGHQDVMNPARHQQLLEFTRNRLRPEIPQKNKNNFRQITIATNLTETVCASLLTPTLAARERFGLLPMVINGIEFDLFTMIFD